MTNLPSKLLFLLILFFSTSTLRSSAQEEVRVKIVLSVSDNGKSITVPLNSVSTSVSRYYDDVVSVPDNTNSKDSSAVKPALASPTYKAGVFYLNLNVKTYPMRCLG